MRLPTTCRVAYVMPRRATLTEDEVAALEACSLRETFAPAKPPTGVELCRLYQLRAEGPMPASVSQARDHGVSPDAYLTCAHVQSHEHGGNAYYFYSQCVSCRALVELYPRVPTRRCPHVEEQMQAVEEIFARLPHVVQSRRKTQRARARSRPPIPGDRPQPSTAASGPDAARTPEKETPLRRSQPVMTHRGPLGPEPTSGTAVLQKPVTAPSRESEEHRPEMFYLSPHTKRPEEIPPPDSSSLDEAEEVQFPNDWKRPQQTGRKMGRQQARPKRKCTPVAKRVSFDGEETTSEQTALAAPKDALAAMRLLAQVPGATEDTRALLTQLEAHLAATTAAAELDENMMPGAGPAVPGLLTGSPGKWMALTDRPPEP